MGVRRAGVRVLAPALPRRARCCSLLGGQAVCAKHAWWLWPAPARLRVDSVSRALVGSSSSSTCTQQGGARQLSGAGQPACTSGDAAWLGGPQQIACQAQVHMHKCGSAWLRTRGLSAMAIASCTRCAWPPCGGGATRGHREVASSSMRMPWPAWLAYTGAATQGGTGHLACRQASGQAGSQLLHLPRAPPTAGSAQTAPGPACAPGLGGRRAAAHAAAAGGAGWQRQRTSGRSGCST